MSAKVQTSPKGLLGALISLGEDVIVSLLLISNLLLARLAIRANSYYALRISGGSVASVVGRPKRLNS